MLRNLLSPLRFSKLNEGKLEKAALTGVPAAIITQDVKGALPKGLGGHDAGPSKYVLRIQQLPEKYLKLSNEDKNSALLNELLVEINDNSEYKIIAMRQFPAVTIRATLQKVKNPHRKITIDPRQEDSLVMVLEGKNLSLGNAFSPGNIQALHIKEIIRPNTLVKPLAIAYGIH